MMEPTLGRRGGVRKVRIKKTRTNKNENRARSYEMSLFLLKAARGLGDDASEGGLKENESIVSRINKACEGRLGDGLAIASEHADK